MTDESSVADVPDALAQRALRASKDIAAAARQYVGAECVNGVDHACSVIIPLMLEKAILLGTTLSPDDAVQLCERSVHELYRLRAEALTPAERLVFGMYGDTIKKQTEALRIGFNKVWQSARNVEHGPIAALAPMVMAYSYVVAKADASKAPSETPLRRTLAFQKANDPELLWASAALVIIGIALIVLAPANMPEQRIMATGT